MDQNEQLPRLVQLLSKGKVLRCAFESEQLLLQVSDPSQMLKTAGAGWARQGCTAQHRIAAEDPYFRAALHNPLVLQESWCGCSVKGAKSVCVAEGQYMNLIKWWEQIIPHGALSLVAVTKLGHQLQGQNGEEITFTVSVSVV